MFTSRAEHRLLFNHGSAELRLAHHAKAHGLVSAARFARIEEKRRRIEGWVTRLETERTSAGTFAEMLRRDSPRGGLPAEFLKEAGGVKEEVLYRVRYQGYLAREHRQIEKLASIEGVRIPADIDYAQVRGLRKESTLKLGQLRPMTLGQASRISGVNPADIGVLMVWIAARQGRGAPSA